MSTTILSLIGAAWQLGVAGFLGYVFVCVIADHLFPYSAYIVCPDCDGYGGFEDTDCPKCSGSGQVDDEDETDDADEFAGDDWDRAYEQQQDRRWEIAS